MADTQLEENKAVVRKCLETFSKGDIAGVAAMMTEDANWVVKGKLEGLAGTYPRDQFAELAGGATVNYRDKALKIEPVAMTAEGDRVAVEATGYAVMNDGRIYDPEYHLLFRITDGKITEVREYMDTHLAYSIFMGS